MSQRPGTCLERCGSRLGMASFNPLPPTSSECRQNYTLALWEMTTLTGFPARNERQYTERGRLGLGIPPTDIVGGRLRGLALCWGEMDDFFFSFAGPAIYRQPRQNPSEVPPAGGSLDKQLPPTLDATRWATILSWWASCLMERTPIVATRALDGNIML